MSRRPLRDTSKGLNENRGPDTLFGSERGTNCATLRHMSYRVGKSVEPLVTIVSSLAVALDRETGRQLWRYQAATRIVRIVYTSERIFLLDYDCLLHCLRASDGGLLGKVQVDDSSYTGCALIPGSNGELYIGTSNCVVALDPTGREMWRFKHVSVPSSAGAGLAGLALPGAVVQPDIRD